MVMKWIKLLVISMAFYMAFASCTKEDELKIENDYAKINRLEAFVAGIYPDYVWVKVVFDACLKGHDSYVKGIYVRYGENADMSDSLVSNINYECKPTVDTGGEVIYDQIVVDCFFDIPQGKKIYYQAYVEYEMTYGGEKKFVVYDEIRELDYSADRIAQNIKFATSSGTVYDYYCNYIYFKVILSGDPLGLGKDILEYLSPNDIELGVKYGETEDMERAVGGGSYSEDAGCFYVHTDLNTNIMFYQPYARIMGVEFFGEMQKVDWSYVTEGSAIDLGLPSGIKWGSCNLGADNVYEFGDYYGWGNADGGWFVGTKLPADISGTEYDVARAMLGGSWRIPTKEQWEELVSNTTISDFSYNGVSGIRIVGVNGNAIFLPEAGYKDSSGYYNSVGYIAYYWISVSNGSEAYYYYVNGRNDYSWSMGRIKMPIRPVCD